MKVDKAPT